MVSPIDSEQFKTGKASNQMTPKPQRVIAVQTAIENGTLVDVPVTLDLRRSLRAI